MIALALENVLALQQGARLIRRIDSETYRCNMQQVKVSSVGEHVRHNLDHYMSFFSGLDSGMIDYDARLREKVIEIDQQVALDVTERICTRLVNLAEPNCFESLRIRCEPEQGSNTNSSVIRELSFLLSHTIHHHAIIAMLCRLQNVEVEAAFGVAPSTLHYRALSKPHPAGNGQACNG